MRLRFLTAPLLLATSLLVGCKTDRLASPAVAPGSLYVLRSVADQSVPALAVSNSILTARILADTITLRPDGTGVISALLQYQNNGSSTVTTEQFSDAFTYVLDGTQIAVTLNCPMGAMCTVSPQFSGQLLPTGIRFDKANDYLVPMVFERTK